MSPCCCCLEPAVRLRHEHRETSPGRPYQVFWQPKIRGFLSHEKQLFLVSTSSRKAFRPWLSVSLLWAHFSPRQAEQSGAQSHATPTRDAGEYGLPFVCSELAAWLFHLTTPDLLADAPMKNQSFLRSLFATSEMPPLAFPPSLTSPQAAVPAYLISSHTKAIPRTRASLSPCCSSPVATSFWSSDGCIFTCISYFFRVSVSWQKGNTDDSASHGAHTDVCICSNATEGECALQVHSPLMYTLSAVGLCSSTLCRT